MPKPKSYGKKISEKLEVLHIRTSCVLLHTLKVAKRYGQLNPTKRYDEHMSTIDECRRKVMRAKGLLVAAEIGSGFEELAEPKNPDQGQEMDVQFLWAEKWCPKRLTDFICNKQQALDLQFLVALGHCPHMIFEGPPGAGKSSLIRAMIGDIFHSNDNQIREGKITIHLKENLVTRMVVPIKASSKHIELNLNGLGGYEMNVVDLLLKEHNSKIIANSSVDRTDCKVMVLDGADILSNEAQHYIRWLMERYQDSCKLIFCCSNANKLQIIKSLCKVVKVKNPSIEQIVQVLEDIADKEGSDLPTPFIRQIAENSDKNLHQAIRSLEATIKSQYV
ncbi:hypothetical protein SUGI_0804900 [Cryptomeria japonica]|nr:hypothetical protein SUGI_0804900 [Cryptomeria japonica]